MAVNGATVDAYVRNTSAVSQGNTTTNASGYWTLTVVAQDRYDIKVVNGSSTSWLSYDDQVQIQRVETAELFVINPANTFKYNIVPAAIIADRTLNLPLLTGTATVAAIDEGVKGADIVSAATLTLVAGSDFADVTGTVTVTAISTRPAGSRFTFQFDGALTLTHNATTLILQGSVNLVTAAGDVLTFISEGGGNWREKSRRLAAAAPARATQAAIEAETDEATYVSPNRARNSPGVAKAYCQITGPGALAAGSYNVTSVTDTGTGDRTIVWNTDFSSADYSVVGALESLGHFYVDTHAVGSVHLTTTNTANTITDRASGQAAFGDQ